MTDDANQQDEMRAGISFADSGRSSAELYLAKEVVPKAGLQLSPTAKEAE